MRGPARDKGVERMQRECNTPEVRLQLDIDLRCLPVGKLYRARHPSNQKYLAKWHAHTPKQRSGQQDAIILHTSPTGFLPLLSFALPFLCRVAPTLTPAFASTHRPVVVLGRVVDVIVRVPPRTRPPGRIHPQVPQPAHLIGRLIVPTVHHQTGEG